MSAGEEEMGIALLRHAAIGERLAAMAHGRLRGTRTGQEFWGEVRELSGMLGLAGVCLMLDGWLYEDGERGGAGRVVAVRVPRGRVVVRVDRDTRPAMLAVVWVVKRALEDGAGRAPGGE